MDKNGYQHLFNAFPMILKWVEKYEHLHFLGIYIYIFFYLMAEIRISNMLMQCIKSIQEILPTNVKQNI